MPGRSKSSHPLKPPSTSQRQMPGVTPKPPKWPSYTGTSQFVGTTPSGRVTVFVDPKLSSDGLKNAQDLVNDADRVVTANDQIFGITGGKVNVIVFAMGGATDGTGGADHMGCTFQTGGDIEVCAAFGNSIRVSALFEAELSECAMNGSLCGYSTGEALSRWCAAVIGQNTLADFATAPQWVRDGMPNYVDTTDPTDQSADSTGCGVAFVSWLISLGYTLDKIAQTMVALGDSGTFADLYAKLTSDSARSAWKKFQTALEALSGGVTSDDPFGAMALATPANRGLWTAELAARVFSTIVTDISAGKDAQQIVAGVRGVMEGRS